MKVLRRFCAFLILLASLAAGNPLKLAVVTYSLPGTDEHSRLIRSAKFFNLTVVNAGVGNKCSEKCRESSISSVNKVNFPEQSFSEPWNSENVVLMLVDSSDILVGSANAILDAFRKTNARVVLSKRPTSFCDGSNKDCITVCSGRMIGYKEDFLTVVKKHFFLRPEDQKACFSDLYNNATLRSRLNATFDDMNTIFQNVDNDYEKTEMHVLRNMTIIQNLKHNTFPAVLYSDATSKLRLNYLSNYVPNGWHPHHKCKQYEYTDMLYPHGDDAMMPHVVVAIFLLPGSPFLREFFGRVANLSYPKSRMTLVIHQSASQHERESALFLLRYRKMYKSVHIASFLGDRALARKSAVHFCLQHECDFFFSIDSSVQITNPITLKHLIKKNRRIIAPLVKKHKKLWSNFWGSVNKNGYYSRSDDYLAIIGKEKIGVWNVPFLNSIYLVNKNALMELTALVPNTYVYEDLPTDMAFCHHIRKNRIFMFVTNEENFGRLLEIDETRNRENKLHPDLWEVERNEADWLEKYVHPEFWNVLNPETKLDVACPGVYRFPFLTETFADEMIDTVEAANLWSDGSIVDDRQDVGYNGAPSITVFAKEFGFKAAWMHFLMNHFAPVVTRIYHGYATSCKSAKMFVARYRADEQADVLPHHDASIVTINVALNTQKKDYEGGGCHFLRHNCSVLNLPKGWAIVHPGILTHYHQGLPTTSGVRYIMVSFIDPVQAFISTGYHM